MNNEEITLKNQDFYAIVDNSLEELKNKDLSNIRNIEGEALTHWAVKSNNFDFLSRLLQAGIDINVENWGSLHAGYYIGNSKNPYKMLNIMLEYNLDIFYYNHNKPLIKYFLSDLKQANKKQIDSFSKTQMYLVENDTSFLSYIKENKKISIDDIALLSSFTPEVLQFLINDKNIDVFSICDDLGDNLISYILNTNDLKQTYHNLELFDELLTMMNIEQINHLNKKQENYLWQLYKNPDETIDILKKHGLNFNQLDKNGLGVMETHGIYLPELNQKLQDRGTHLSPKFLMDILRLKEEEIHLKYKIKGTPYTYFYDIAKKEYSLLQKSQIQESLSQEEKSTTLRNKRL